MAIAQDLDLDVTWVVDVLLHQERPITKGALSLTRGGRDRIGKPGLLANESHALSASTCTRLEQNGETDLESLFREVLRILARTVVSGNHRNAGLIDQRLGFALRAHRPNGIGAGSDEDDVGLAACLRKRRILRQEAVPGVNRVGVRERGSLEDLVDAQVALAARRGAQQNRFVRLGDERHRRVCIGVDRHGRNSHLAASPHDATGNLAPVGNEDLLNRSAQRPLAPQ